MKSTSRRKFIIQGISGSIAAGALAGLPNNLLASNRQQQNLFAQSPLPYAYAALEPVIDSMTMEIHYTKHAAAYTKNLNEAALAEFKGANITLEDALKNISTYSPKLRNNGGGHYNHELFWKIMKAPNGSGLHDGPLKEAMMKQFNATTASAMVWKADPITYKLPSVWKSCCLSGVTNPMNNPTSTEMMTGFNKTFFTLSMKYSCVFPSTKTLIIGVM